MAYITFLYMNDDKMFSDELRIEIDNNKIGFAKKSEPFKFEVAEGNHNLSVYTFRLSDTDISLKTGKESATVNDQIWLNENININKDTYYIFKSPLFVKGRGKLIEVSEKKFNWKLKTSKSKIYNIAIELFEIAIVFFLAILLNIIISILSG